MTKASGSRHDTRERAVDTAMAVVRGVVIVMVVIVVGLAVWIAGGR